MVQLLKQARLDHGNAVTKGFYDGSASQLAACCGLIHTELWEASNAEGYVEYRVEIADVIIRSLDLIGFIDANIEPLKDQSDAMDEYLRRKYESHKGSLDWVHGEVHGEGHEVELSMRHCVDSACHAFSNRKIWGGIKHLIECIAICLLQAPYGNMWETVDEKRRINKARKRKHGKAF